MLCKNFLLQTLIYLPRRHGLQYVLNKKRIGTGGSPANWERQLAARRSSCIRGALQKLSFTDADLLAAAALTTVCAEQEAKLGAQALRRITYRCERVSLE